MTTRSFNARHGITVGVNQVSIADANGNVTANTILVGGSALNSTAFAGTANNATYFNNQAASYYTNANNLSTGTINVLRLPTSGVTANVYGNSSSIPVITVDTYGRVTSLSTSAVAGVTSFTYTAANSTFALGTGDGSTYTATITAANSTVAGIITVIDSTTNTSISIAASANTVKNAFDRALDANTRAASAQTAAISAYSNAVSFATDAAANAYSNATSYAANVADTAYSNAVSVAASDATSKANNAYTTAVSAASTDATNKAANAYSNAVSYAASIAGTAYSNAVSVAASDATTKANNAYTTAVAAAASDATTKANNAYTTAVAAAASDATTKANSAYTTAVAAASSDASSKAGVAYVNATTFAANASNINSGTIAEARLPYRMDQNVRTTDTVEFHNAVISGNLTVTGTTVTINANNLSVEDNMIYLNNGNAITNPDLGIAGNYNDGTYRHAGFFRDATDGVWKVYDQYLPEPDSSPYIDTSNASFRVADFQANVVTIASANVGGATINSTSYSGAANNASYLGTYAANNYPRKSEAAAITGTWDFSNTGILWSGHSFTNTLDGSNVYLHIGTATSTNKIWNLRVFKADNNYATFVFNSSGVATAENSFRAPVFYDTDNTSYYLDPHNGSNLYTTKFNTATNGAAGRTVAIKDATVSEILFGSYPGGWTSALQIQNNDNSDFVWISPLDVNNNARIRTGGCGLDFYTDGANDAGTYSLFVGSGYATGQVSLRAPIFYDSDDTSYYVNPASTSVLSAVSIGNTSTRRVSIASNGLTDFRFDDNSLPYAYLYNGGLTAAGQGYGIIARLGSDATNFYDGGRIQFYTEDSYASAGLRNSSIRMWTAASGSDTERFRISSAGAVTAFVDMRAPIFYDSDNTTYYTNPAGTSNVVTVQASNGDGLRNYGTASASISSSIYFANAGNTRAWNWQLDENNNAALWNFEGSSWNKRFTFTSGSGFTAGGTITAIVDVRAPIFYDSDNTTYFANPAGTSVFNGGSFASDLKLPAAAGDNKFVAGTGDGASLSTYNFRLEGWYGMAFYNPTVGGAFPNQASGFVDFRNGIIQVAGSHRAPTFYDSDNTSYYLDPASTTYINQLQILGGNPVYPAQWTTGFQSSSDFADGTLVTTDIPATASAGDSFIIEITGKSYSATNLPFKVIAQGYLYNDTIINYTGTSYGGTFSSYIKAFQDGGVLKFWWPRISYWNSFEVRVISMDGPTNNTITRNRITAIGNATEPTGTKKVQINLAYFMRGDVTATNAEDLRAPIFYDSNDTGYYTNPASTSRLNQINYTAMYNAANTDYGIVGNNGFFDTVNSGAVGDALELCYVRGNEVRIGPSGGNLPVKAATYYDYADTSYYLDPNATSQINYIRTGNVINIGGVLGDATIAGSAFHGIELHVEGNRDYYIGKPAGAWTQPLHIHFYTGIWYRAHQTFGGHRFYDLNDGAMKFSISDGSNIVKSYIAHHAPIFYDSDNTEYYFDGAGTTQMNTVNVYGVTNMIAGTAQFWSSASGAYQRVDSRNDASLYARMHWYGVRNDGATSNFRHAWYDGSAYFYIDADTGVVTFSRGGGAIITSTGSFRAPIFYDSDNTAYYVDPASTASSNFAGYSYFANHGGGIVGNYSSYRFQLVYGMGDSYKGTLDGTSVAGGYGLWFSHPNAGGVAANLSTHGMMLIQNGSWMASFDPSMRALNDMRAPIFYDLNDTSFYINPHETSVTRVQWIKNWGGTAASPTEYVDWPIPALTVSAFGNYTSQTMLAFALPNDGNYFTGAEVWNFRISQTANSTTSAGVNTMNFVGPGTLYFGPSNYTETAGSSRAPIFYDSNNTSYYIDPAGGSLINNIYNYGWYRSYGDAGWYSESYGGGIFMQDSTYVRVYNGKALYVPNEILATGNITAYYSDERLKTRVGNIRGALDKVLRLDGFFYTENETARELGYDNDRQQVGVSAQKVQEVLPEAVHMAPVDVAVDEDGNKYSKTGENYLTVDYSRIVPLLIEAIKEQQLTISEQSAKINTLEHKLDKIIQKLEG